MTDESGGTDESVGPDEPGGPDAPEGSDEPSAVDADEVRHVADLARIDLDDEEVSRFAEQFVDILAAFESLDEVPDVEAEADLANVMRPDETRDSLDQEAALANASETEAGHFKGPHVS